MSKTPNFTSPPSKATSLSPINIPPNPIPISKAPFQPPKETNPLTFPNGSSIIYTLRALISQDIPLNQGCLTPITVIIPKGSFLSPSGQAAVVGGNVLTSQRVTDVILRAFGACAASQGCCNNLTFGTSNSHLPVCWPPLKQVNPSSSLLCEMAESLKNSDSSNLKPTFSPNLDGGNQALAAAAPAPTPANREKEAKEAAP